MRSSTILALAMFLGAIGMTVPGAAQKLVFTQDDNEDIYICDLDGSNLQVIASLTTAFSISGVAVDEFNQKIYVTAWSSNVDEYVFWCNYDGSGLQAIVTGDEYRTANEIAVDPVGGKIYWTAWDTDSVFRADLDGDNIETLVTGISAEGIDLDVAAGKMYFGEDFGDVHRANLDGTSVEIATSVGNRVRGIALDLVNDKVYWGEYISDGRVARSNLDGTGAELVVNQRNAWGVVLDVPNDTVYYTDFLDSQVWRASLSGSNPQKIVDLGTAGMGYIDLISVYDLDGPRLLALNDVEQSEGVDELLSIPNVSSGVAGLIGSLGDNFIETEALAALLPQFTKPANGLQADPTGDLICAVDDDRLLQVEVATGNGIEVGPIGFSDVDGISFNPLNGKLMGVTHSSNELIEISTATGQGTLVADDVIVGRKLEDIAFHPNGDAYVLTSGPRIYKIDIQTGEKLAKWELEGGESLESLIWSPDGSTLYSAADRDDTKDLVTIELSNVDETGTITFVSNQPSGFADIEALVFLTPSTVIALTAALSPTPVDSETQLPRRVLLHQNVPNPFNPQTSIRFDMPREGHVELTVYDAAGRQVAQLLSEHRSAGSHRVTWNGRTDRGALAAAGVYQYVLRLNGSRESGRMVLLK